jgi:hypothetical protein
MLGAALALGIPIPVFSSMPEDRRRALLGLKFQIDEIDRKLAQADYGVSHISREARSPSPDPVFDDMGNQLNTREERTRIKLLRQRDELVQQTRPPEPPKPAGKRCAPRGCRVTSRAQQSAPQRWRRACLALRVAVYPLR